MFNYVILLLPVVICCIFLPGKSTTLSSSKQRESDKKTRRRAFWLLLPFFVMLALKSVIADKDSISTLIFDEIDAGVSGKTARKIGIKMLELSKSSQIFSVTHSAQIASLANGHYLISKSDLNGATATSVKLLDY